jgi:acetyltransferase-like isoleucine patch superfamily enzyme
VLRRVRLLWVRLRYPRAVFGRGCDVRRRFELRIGRRAQARFGRRCVIDKDATVEVEGTLVVGDRTIFGHHLTLAARESVVIGEDCLIAELVSIRDHDHCFDLPDVPTRDQGAVISPVRIGRNVWVGAKVTIVKGVSIGDNAVIGANAVVTRDVPPNAVAVGIPAKVIRMRNDA